MVPALIAALVPVLLGALLARAPARLGPLLGPARTFAFAAALSVVLANLLPEAAAAAGAAALGLFAAGLIAPWLLERAMRRLRPTGTPAGRWLALAALGLHQAMDGVQVGAAGLAEGGAGVALAVAAHTTPLVAVALLPTRPAPSGLLGWLLGTTALGVLLGHPLAAHPGLAAVQAPVQAVLAGLLLHLVGHGLEGGAPRGAAARTADLLALFAGLVLPLVGHALGLDHHHGPAGHGPESPELVFLAALAELTAEAAPLLLVGMVLGAAVQALGTRLPARFFASSSVLGGALRGAVVGAPLPLCACGVLPLAETLARRGAAAALVVGFLLATPELGVETVALSVRFLGWPFAIVRLIGALVLAIGAGVAVGLVVARGHAPAVLPALGGPGHGSFAVRFVRALDTLVLHTGPWVGAGLLLAAYIEVYLPAADLAALGRSGWDVPLVTVVAVPSYVCASAATPLAAVIWQKGLSAGAVLTGLLLGPATNVATLVFVRRWFGGRGLAALLGAVIPTAWAFAGLANVLLPAGPPVVVVDAAAHAHGVGAAIGTALLALLVGWSVWRAGARAWVAELFHVGSDHAHTHDHGHTHDHAHTHDHGHTHAHGHTHDHDHGHTHDPGPAPTGRAAGAPFVLRPPVGTPALRLPPRGSPPPRDPKSG